MTLQAMLRPVTALISISAILTHAVTACEWGKYGDDCDKHCPTNCQVNLQRNLTHCNKETGECSDGCITGWYDPQCDQLCSKNCLDNVCNHGNGHCTLGCSGNQTGDFCEITKVSTRTYVKVTTDETTGLSTANVALIISISLITFIVIIVVAVIIKRRRQRDRRTSTDPPNVYTDPEDPNSLEGALLIPGEVPSSSNDQTEDEYAGVMARDMLEWEIKKTEDVFQETAYKNKVKERLEKFRHVTIAGASGEGKTSLALMLGSEYQKKGYKLYFVNNISEFKLRVVSKDKDQCFIFDDIFGTVGMSTDSPHLTQMLDCLKYRLEQLAYYVSENPHCSSPSNDRNANMGNILIIFTTKSYNLEQGKLCLGGHDYMFFKVDSVIDLTQTDRRYTVKEKKEMFLKHKKYKNNNCNFDLDKICRIGDQLFGFPLTCKLFFDFPKSHEQYEQFFMAPLAYLRRELKSLLKQKNNHSAALILMLLCEGNLNLRQLEIKSVNQTMEAHIATVSAFLNGFQRSEVALSVRAFAGTFFTRGDIVRFSHPSIYDACAFVLHKINPAFVLQHCSIRFLYERVQAETVPERETDEDMHVIYVTDVYSDIIASRLAGAIKQRNFRMSIMHPILKRHNIVDKVIGELGSFLSDTSVTDEHGNTIFYYTCFTGNMYLVGKLMAFCNINIKDADGFTPILNSAMHGMEDVFELLVSNGADLNFPDVCNDTILHIACKGGNMSIVERLLPTTDIDLKGQDGRTPVMYAALSGKKHVFELLVSKGANLKLKDDYNDTVLHLACQGGHTSIVECLLPLFDINSRGRNGWTAVKRATVFGKNDVVDLLASKGADLSVTDDYNDTIPQQTLEDDKPYLVECMLPLFKIDFLKKDEVLAPTINLIGEMMDSFVKEILPKGADLEQIHDYGNAIFAFAEMSQHLPFGSEILQALNMNCRGENGLTGVMKAAAFAKKDAFDRLVSLGADITLTDDNNNTVLHYACIGGSRSIIEYLLPLIDINCKGECGWTAVMTAAVSAKKMVVDMLVSKGADLTLTDDNNDTVLHLACRGGNRSIVEYILPLFDINSRGHHGLTAVMVAAEYAKKDVFDLLVSKGADLTLTARHNLNLLHVSCKGANTDIVKHVLPMFDINYQGYKGWTPVMFGALSGKNDTFGLLLSKGANPSLTGDDNDTLLHAACEGGNIDIVRRVIGDFDINTRGDNGLTPLMRAVSGGHTDVVDFLVGHGADVNMVNNDGDGLLHLACGRGNVKIAKHVRSYSDLELRNRLGWTPLAEAAVDRSFAVFKYLKSEGAHLTLFDKTGDDLATLALQGGCRSIAHALGLDVSSRFMPWNRLMRSLVKSNMYCLEHYDQKSPALVQRDQYGDSLLHLACRGGNAQCVEYLLPSYDINVRGRYGWTAVMMAAVCGHGKVFMLLVAHKADLTLVSDKGERILTLAQRGNNDDIVKYLLGED